MVCPGFCHAGGWGGVPKWSVTKNTRNRRFLPVPAVSAAVPGRVPEWPCNPRARVAWPAALPFQIVFQCLFQAVFQDF